MKRRDALKRILIAPFVPLSHFTPKSVFASEPILPDQQFSGFTKQNSPQLDQILPRATVQSYGNVTVYSTVGVTPPQTQERWSYIWDLWIRGIGWYWLDQIPKQFKAIMVSEAEFVWAFRHNTTAGGVFLYPDEVWFRALYRADAAIIHELLHRVLSWIYYRNNIFTNTRVPGNSPLIVAAGELALHRLNSEVGPNPTNPIIVPSRFNRLWEITKEIMQGAGFIGLENVPIPLIIDCSQGCALGRNTAVSQQAYAAYQNLYETGEIYLAITMFSRILDFYNFHSDRTGIFTTAVCNIKKTLNQEKGFVGGDGELTQLENGQVIGCLF